MTLFGLAFRWFLIIGFFYLIFTNFGIFLMILGGVVLSIFLIIYFVKKKLQQRAQQFEFKFQNFSDSNYRNFDFREFGNFDFNNTNNRSFNGNFYTQSSKIEEAKEFFGFSSTPTKDEIKKKYKELARVYHPDLNGGDDEKMKKLNEYRDILIQNYS